jgi:XTP/dITP diphosphohydrolase
LTKQPFEILLVATRNPAKAKNYKGLLAKYAGRVVDLEDLGIHGTAEEGGETSEVNAEMKARFYAEQSGCAAFSDDAALYVDFLPPERQPGVHVRRMDGKEAASDERLLVYWENALVDVPFGERTGRWHVAFCLAYPDGKKQTFSLDLPIVFFSPSSPIKTPGWPLNSLSGPLGFNKPYSELSEVEYHLANRAVDRMVARTFEEMLE